MPHIELNPSQSDTIKDAIKKLEEIASDLNHLYSDLEDDDNNMRDFDPEGWPGTADQAALLEGIDFLGSTIQRIKKAVMDLDYVTEIL